MSKVNINDPTAWQSLDWDEPAPIKIKSDHAVNVARAARVRSLHNENWIKNVANHNKEQKGKSWVKDAKENDDPAYLEWKKLHDAGSAKNPDNPEWLAKIQESNRSRNSTPEFIAKVKAGLERYVEANGDVIKARNRISNTNPEHIANRKAGIKEFFADPVASAAAREARSKAHSKPFHAGEYGDFKSMTAAVEHVTRLGLLANARKKFIKWLKTDPTNYYYLKNNANTI